MFENLNINLLDIGILVILFLGGIIGLALGFVRAGLFVVSWLGAGIATLFGLPIVRLFARKHIEDEFLADMASGVGIFLLTLIVLFLLSSLIGGWVRESRLNALDRSLGMVAGLATSVFLVTGAYIVMENVLPEEKRGNLITEAKSLPFFSASARLLKKSLPQNLNFFNNESFSKTNDKVIIKPNKSVFDRLVLPDSANPVNKDRLGYDKKERNNLERAIELFNN